MAARRNAEVSQKLVSEIVKTFGLNRNGEIAAKQKKYMRNQFDFFGLKKPTIMALSKPIIAANPIKELDQLQKTVLQLWEQNERECQNVAMEILLKYKKLWKLELISTVEVLVRNKSWWDTVDYLATNVVGGLVKANLQELTPKMNEWIEDENLWIRRTAILHQLKYKKETDSDLLFSYIRKTWDEQDFFTRKAIGWALREFSKTEPQLVRTFIDENSQTLSTLSKSEGGKYC